MFDQLYNLLQKYDVPAPRYTSYPTVLAWTPNVTVLDYEKSLKNLKNNQSTIHPPSSASGGLRRTGDPRSTISLYFHLPFCESLCHFCGCMQVITKDHSRSREYVDMLLKEIDLVIRRGGARPAPPWGTVAQIHFGGGTPNFIQPRELTEIMESVRAHFNVSPDAEVSIEMHPRTSTKEFCENLKTLGFNRISLGVQDLDSVVQKMINRHQTYEMTRDMMIHLRSLGFHHFNIDLVYGLPGQTMQGWEQTLKQVVGLKPTRLAVYSYAHVPWARPVQRTFEDSDLPPPGEKLRLFEKAYQAFTSNGYRHIGIDHFALANDELCQALDDGTIHRNFMGYSTRADSHQIGFGVSAISYVNGNYFQNQKTLKDYYEKINEEKFATFRGFLLDNDDSLRRDLITQIMCRSFVDLRTFEKKWGIKFWDYFTAEKERLVSFIEDGLLEITDDIFAAKGEGKLFLRNMAMVFDGYHEGIKRQSLTPAFSRAV